MQRLDRQPLWCCEPSQAGQRWFTAIRRRENVTEGVLRIVAAFQSGTFGRERKWADLDAATKGRGHGLHLGWKVGGAFGNGARSRVASRMAGQHFCEAIFAALPGDRMARPQYAGDHMATVPIKFSASQNLKRFQSRQSRDQAITQQ